MKILENVVIISLLALIVYLAGFYGRNESKVYPCHLAEISPDYPPDVKAMCRKLTKKVEEK